MNKKILGAAIICIFMSALGLRAQEKVYVYEHLAWAQTGLGEYILDTLLDNPAKFVFESGPFLSFGVPPSPKAQAIFFEFWGQSLHRWWVGYTPQSFSAMVKIKFISNLIPAAIEVYHAYGLTGIVGITHSSSASDRNKRNWKVILRRDSMLREYTDWWDIRYTGTGEKVPNDIAQGILNELIDKGFNVEVSLSGDCEGIKEFMFYSFQVEVTRLVKKQ